MENNENFLKDSVVNPELTPTKTMRDTLKNMIVGDIIFFPIVKYRSIRTTCSDLKFLNHISFKTKLIKDQNAIAVERIY